MITQTCGPHTWASTPPSLSLHIQAERTYTSNRFLSTKLGTAGADPGNYALPGAVGPQPSSLRRSSPAFSLPRTDRMKSEYDRMASSLPPPTQHSAWTSLGKQPLSLSRTMPAWGFGRSTWDREEKRYLTQGHTRELRGSASPANYDHQNPSMVTSFGRQVSARVKHYTMVMHAIPMYKGVHSVLFTA